MKSRLQQQFLADFLPSHQFTTKEVFEWYKLHKTNPLAPAYRSNVYMYILEPLIHMGIVERIGSGIYRFAKLSQLDKEEDEWDQYARSKMEGGDKDVEQHEQTVHQGHKGRKGHSPSSDKHR